MRIKRVLAVIVTACVIAMITPGCVPPIYLRQVNILYIINIAPLDGETPTDVTMLLPFPTEEGKPVQLVLNEIQNSYRENVAKYVPGVTFVIADTKYGKMLRVHIPKLTSGVDVGCDRSFNSVFKNQPERDRFPLSGVSYVKTREVFLSENDGYQSAYCLRVYRAQVFVKYRNAKGLIFRNNYAIDHTGPMQLGYRVGSGGGRTIIGTYVPITDNGPYEVKIDSQGWVEMPAYGTGDKIK